MERRPIPTMSEAIEGQQRMAIDKLLEAVEDGNLQMYKTMAEQLLDEMDSVTLVSAALKLMTKEPSKAPVRLTEEAPLRMKKRNFDDRNSSKYRGNQKGRKGPSSSNQKPGIRVRSKSSK